jgi:competence protein ComEA
MLDIPLGVLIIAIKIIIQFLRSFIMSLLRKLAVAVAALSLATVVFADDMSGGTDTTTGTTDTTTTTTAPTSTTDTQTATPATDTTAAATDSTTKTDSTTTTTTTTASADKVDLNKATVRELMKVKGLNAARAKAIVTYRKKHGDFKSIEDLKEVKGFKKLNDKKFQTISDQVTAG